MEYNNFVLIIGIATYILTIYSIYKILEKRKNILSNKNIIIVIFTITIILQLIFSILFKVNPTWDFNAIYNHSRDIALGKTDIGSINYLYKYNNNVGITILFSVIFKIATLVNIKSLYMLGVCTNILFINISIFFTYLVAKKIFGYNKSILVLLLLCTMTPIYTYSPIFYTDTISLPFIIMPIYLYMIYGEEKNKSKKDKIVILLSFILFIGAMIKFTVIIPFIALVIYKVIYERLKNNIRFILILLVSIICLVIFQKLFISIIFTEKKMEKENIPYTHWIMMGLKYDGGFDSEDLNSTVSKKTFEEKKKYNIEQIKSRLNNYYKEGKLLYFYTGKLMYSWGDGTYYAPEKLRREPVSKGIQHEFILYNGKYNQSYMYYAQIQHLAILTLFIFSSLKALTSSINGMHSKINRYSDYEKMRFVFLLSILGLIILLLIWEARSRYIVNFMPIFCLSALYGIDTLNDTFIVFKNKYKKIYIR